MIPRRIMQPSLARDSGQLDPRCSTQTYHRPDQRTRPSPRTRELLLISRPAEGRRLSWPEHTVVSTLLKVACKGPGQDSHSQRESYEYDTLSLDHLHLEAHGREQLPTVATRQCACLEPNLRPLDHKSNALSTTLPRHPRQKIH